LRSLAYRALFEVITVNMLYKLLTYLHKFSFVFSSQKLTDFGYKNSTAITTVTVICIELHSIINCDIHYNKLVNYQ